MTEPLHIKWRPTELDAVLGQEVVVKNIARLFEAKRVPHCLLFTGPSGTGKTTIARIVASMLNIEGANLIEVDAARFSGIDQMRDLITNSRFVGLSDNSRRMIIIDECHACSKATFQTLLLSTEEPPEHLYWALCSTEPEKIPVTIRTRSHAYELKPVKWDMIAEFLEYVAMEDKLAVKKEFIDLAARRAEGSVRQALVYLSSLDGIITKAEALQVVREVDETADGPVALARMLVSGQKATWPNAVKLIQSFEDVPPETIRLTVLHYATNSLLKTTSEGQAQKMLAIVDAFSKPCASNEKLAPILLAVGSLLVN